MPSHLESDLDLEPQPASSDRISLKIPGVDASLTLCLHGQADQFVSRTLRENAIWEPYETELVVASLKAGDVFLDVGANIGYFTVLAAQLVGQGSKPGKVFAFEPDAHNCALLRQSAALNQLTEVIELSETALSNEAGEGVLYLSEDNLGDHQVYASGEVRKQRAITFEHGSHYLGERFSQLGLAQLDLVKIDTQGSEFQVVEGLMPLLKGLAVKPRLLIELTPYSLRAAGASGRALVALLAQLKLPFWIVDHIEHELVLTSEAELALWCDNVDSVPNDEGFMNIFVGEAPERSA
ncbi:MAG: FkbM family methyltransferase [Halioglobus sp.]